MWTCHTRRSHSLGGLPGRRLVFAPQISILGISLLEKDETEIVRYNLKITQTKVLPVWLFFFPFPGQRPSFTSTSLITHPVSTELLCCTQKCKGLSISYLCILFFRPAFSSIGHKTGWVPLPGRSGDPTHQVGAVLGLSGLYVLRHSQVDELVLGFCLHHARALLSHHLDVFWDVDITVQTWRLDRKVLIYGLGESKWNKMWILFYIFILFIFPNFKAGGIFQTYPKCQWSQGSYQSPKSSLFDRFQHCII